MERERPTQPLHFQNDRLAVDNFPGPNRTAFSRFAVATFGSTLANQSIAGQFADFRPEPFPVTVVSPVPIPNDVVGGGLAASAFQQHRQ
ncbi:hypothetical protein [Rhodopirellula sp. P2]|uniref:hypothetical protein n=1 Tax=Rhodopirellula sp. P2 TaxID=2127060 RepID=UPI0023686E3E|nr:hypothetical protein [Rhodopirellula sp. P2]WDQ16796.1 hypothetical protein PSR62_24735 [Rhodopirellula sp. P2]